MITIAQKWIVCYKGGTIKRITYWDNKTRDKIIKSTYVIKL